MRVCLNCNEKISGRSDKVFCDKACRNEFHNWKRNADKRRENEQIRSLRQNKIILDRLFSERQEERIIIERFELEKRHFDWEAYVKCEHFDKGFILRCLDYDLVVKKHEVDIRLSKEVV